MQLFPYHLNELGYIGLYLSLALGIMGIPIPDEALMTYVGFLVYKGEFIFGYSLLFSFLGSITGMSLSFFIGKGVIGPLANRFKAKYEKSFATYENLFAKYGNMIIIIGYFLPGIRHLTAYSSGLLKMNYARFLIFASLGGLLWVTTFILLGYNLGNEWLYVFQLTVRYKKIAIALAVLYILALIFIATRKMRFTQL